RLRVAWPDIVLVEVEEDVGEIGHGGKVLYGRPGRGRRRWRRSASAGPSAALQLLLAAWRGGAGPRPRPGRAGPPAGAPRAGRGPGRGGRGRLRGRRPFRAAAEGHGGDEQEGESKMGTARKHDASFWPALESASQRPRDYHGRRGDHEGLVASPGPRVMGSW